MRSLRLHGPRDLRMHDEPIPEPRAGEVLIRIMSVGICASDVHYYREARIGVTTISDPLVIGHEASGVVSALGEGVTGLSVGDRVAIEPASPCMECEYCRSGHGNICPDVLFFGTPPTDGCLREFITWPAHLALKMPDSLSFDEIAMLEPMAVGVYAVELSEVLPGDRAVILGVGAIGLSVLQSLRVAGVEHVLVSEPVAERRRLAVELGATEAVEPSALSDAVDRITGSRGADVVFECTGEEIAVRGACRIARPLGRLIICGIPDGDDYPFDASSARRKQLTAVFVRRSNQTTERAMEWASQGRIDIARYATHRFPLEGAADAMELAMGKSDGVIRAMIRVQNEE